MTLELGVDLRLELRPSLLTLGEQERIVEHLSQAESLAEELGDKRRIGRVLADMSAYFCGRVRTTGRLTLVSVPWRSQLNWAILGFRLLLLTG